MGPSPRIHARATPAGRERTGSRAPDGTPFVILGRRRLPIKGASFGIELETEQWIDRKRAWLYGPDHLRPRYWLSVTVDEHSGEDGAAWPEADVIPIERATGGRHPVPAGMPGLVVDDEGDWEAWFGNDAPPLEENRLAFGTWDGTRIEVDWHARYATGRAATRPFRFRGAVPFAGLRLKVKAAVDARPFVQRVFGPGSLAGWRRTNLGWIDYGPSMPADRRQWLEVRYRPPRQVRRHLA